MWFWLLSIIVLVFVRYIAIREYRLGMSEDEIKFEQYQEYYHKKYPNHPESDYERCGRFWMEYVLYKEKQK